MSARRYTDQLVRLTVVIPDGNQVAELEVASKRASLAGDTLHETSIAKEDVSVVVDEVKAVLVVEGGEVGLCDSETDSAGDTLAERTGSQLDT